MGVFPSLNFRRSTLSWPVRCSVQLSAGVRPRLKDVGGRTEHVRTRLVGRSRVDFEDSGANQHATPAPRRIVAQAWMCSLRGEWLPRAVHVGRSARRWARPWFGRRAMRPHNRSVVRHAASALQGGWHSRSDRLKQGRAWRQRGVPTWQTAPRPYKGRFGRTYASTAR